MQSKVDAETLAGFVAEVRGYLPQILSFLERDHFDAEEAEVSLRHLHTVRGAASQLGLDQVSAFASDVEAALVGKVVLDEQTRSQCLDVLAQLDQCLEESLAAEPPTDDLDELFAQFDKPPAPPLPDPAPEVGTNLLEVFALEAADHLRTLAELLPLLRQRPEDKNLIIQARRSVHTLKGSAAVVGLRQISQLSHRAEDLLDLLHEGGLTTTAAVVDLLADTTDAIAGLAAGDASDEAVRQLHLRYDAFMGTAPAEDTAEPTPAEPVALKAGERFLRVPVERLDELVRLAGELVVHRDGLSDRLAAMGRHLADLQGSVDRLRRCSSRLTSGYEAAALGGVRPVGHGFDDLELDRYTEFHELTRQLAETVGDVQSLGEGLGQLLGDCDGFVRRQGRLSGDVEDGLTRLRLLPLATISDRLQRTVRTVAAQLGKQVELVLDGEAIGFDRSVLEQLTDPLLHLLRNAVDHGIEPSEVRSFLNKPRYGTVRLRARRDATATILELSDDGAGIDLVRVRSRASELFGLPAAEVDRLTTDELHELLFQSGFTTTNEVTEVSGRGIGLDVVRTAIRQLEGTIRVESQAGKGTTFTIRLPLTMALARAVLVKTHQETWAVPLDAVRLIQRLEPGSAQRREGQEVVRIRGEWLPLVRLGHSLNLKRPAEEPARPPLLVMDAGPRTLAVVVDEVLGPREIVVKPLGGHLRRVRGVMGATVLGDGRVVLIVNPADLDVQPPPCIASRPVTQAKQSVLVVDDSPSVRRVTTGVFANRGWVVSSARDGLEALEMLERGVLPDVVLLDVEMPRMDGYELLAALKSEALYRDIPVIMVTSRAGEKHRRRALDLGASAYLIKPFEERELLTMAGRLARPRASADPRPATTPAAAPR